MGMGGEILLVDREHLPEKRRLIFDFTDGTCSCRQLLVVRLRALPAAAGRWRRTSSWPSSGQTCWTWDFLSSARSCGGKRVGSRPSCSTSPAWLESATPTSTTSCGSARIHPLRKLNTPVGLRESTRCGRASRTACGPAWQRVARSTRWGCSGRKAASCWRISSSAIARASLPALRDGDHEDQDGRARAASSAPPARRL